MRKVFKYEVVWYKLPTLLTIFSNYSFAFSSSIHRKGKVFESKLKFTVGWAVVKKIPKEQNGMNLFIFDNWENKNGNVNWSMYLFILVSNSNFQLKQSSTSMCVSPHRTQDGTCMSANCSSTFAIRACGRKMPIILSMATVNRKEQEMN